MLYHSRLRISETRYWLAEMTDWRVIVPNFQNFLIFFCPSCRVYTSLKRKYVSVSLAYYIQVLLICIGYYLYDITSGIWKKKMGNTKYCYSYQDKTSWSHHRSVLLFNTPPQKWEAQKHISHPLESHPFLLVKAFPKNLVHGVTEMKE